MRDIRRRSTSPPCGNLVDGLPHDCHTEKVANWARVEPRTQMRGALNSRFSSILGSTSAIYAFRLVLELIICKSDNATEKFYWLEVF